MSMIHPSPREDQEWRRLMIGTQTGEASSFAQLIRAVTPFLRSVARKRLRKPNQAERAAQSALVTIHGQRHAYDPKSPIVPWLKSIAEAEAQRFAGAAAR